jgi:CheY-like chemotaxis protein
VEPTVPDPSPDAVPTGSSDAALADEALRLRGRVLGVLGGSAWHELAQPIGGLRSFVTMLRMEGWTAEQLGVDPELVEEATVQAERLARALTDLARGSRRPVQPAALAADVLALAGHLLVDVDASVEIPADAPEPAADPGVLRLVVAGLVVDALAALDATGRAGRGRLSWTARPTPGAEGTALDLVLEDDGRTGPPPTLEVAWRLLAAEGATIRHEPAGDRGNRVVLTLPLGVPAAPGAAAAETDPGNALPHVDPGSVMDGPVIAVLVCDDDPVIRELIVRALTRAGLRALVAGSGAEALATLEREAIDVVVADDRMPGMSGRRLHAEAVARRPGLRRRFVLMSGDGGDPALVAFGEAHGLRILGKPFDLAGLPAVLREVARG